MKQTVLTFIAPVEPTRLVELTTLLTELRADPARSPALPFGALRQLHFASFVIFPDIQPHPLLVFECNFDGALEPYLDRLLQCGAGRIHQIYRCCADYTVRDPAGHAAIIAYLQAHLVRPNAYHVGATGRSVARIRREMALRDAIERFLDSPATGVRPGESPGGLRRRIQTFIKAEPRWAGVDKIGPRQSAAERFLANARLVAAVGAALTLAPVLLIPGVVWMACLLWQEMTDSVWSGQADHDHVQRLLADEDQPGQVQNHMSSLSPVKPGGLRRWTLTLVLWLVNLLARAKYTKGTLGGIPSIHFAHWSLIENGRYLLFLSNFDGSWENYLDDFIDKANRGLTAIWGNTVDFPRTRLLVFGGAEDGPNFKAIARDRQYPTTVWYCAYPDLTVQQIDRNSAIREGLVASLREVDQQRWLQNF